MDLKTKEGLNYLMDMKSNGHSLNSVAKELGVTNGAIRYYLNKYHNMNWTELPPETLPYNNYGKIIDGKGGLSYIIKMKNAGNTKKKIAEDCGFKTSKTIDNYLSGKGVTWKSIGNFATLNSYSDDYEFDLINRVNELIVDNYTASEISEELGVPIRTIMYIFRKNKISFKPIKKHEKKKLVDGKERNIMRSKKVNKTGFYRVKVYKNGFIYSCNGVNYYSRDINELKRKVLDAGLEWIVVDEDKANKTLGLSD